MPDEVVPTGGSARPDRGLHAGRCLRSLGQLSGPPLVTVRLETEGHQGPGLHGAGGPLPARLPGLPLLILQDSLNSNMAERIARLRQLVEVAVECPCRPAGWRRAARLFVEI